MSSRAVILAPVKLLYWFPSPPAADQNIILTAISQLSSAQNHVYLNVHEQ